LVEVFAIRAKGRALQRLAVVVTVAFDASTPASDRFRFLGG
jgi:hypothetical protein